ncbi:Stf0 family sulfotransferase [Ktedonosporobacter rubrisoli]|uniref:Stf0 family sulfotransferase n=1 Tax=Ktedonosporobacter rubrisoli TaxID=2509675 RepID=UPI0013EE6BA1|nr:Stf0 family sulfotransferase [Ktedonosporobacter rubrisoli]
MHRPFTSYIICATQRSGSTLLCEALKNTNLAGYPEEYFDALKSTGVPRRPLEYFSEILDEELIAIFKGRERPDEEQRQPPPGMSYQDYLEHAIKISTSPNGVFGTKVMWGYFPDFISKLRDIPQYQELPTTTLLSTIFPDPHYIYVTRRDKIGQAISLWKALQTWVWRKEDVTNNIGPTRHLYFHFRAIDHLVQLIEQYEESWQQFFAEHDIQPFTIVYEELVETYEATLRAVLRELNIAVPANLIVRNGKLQRQADELSTSWIQQYNFMKQAAQVTL